MTRKSKTTPAKVETAPTEDEYKTGKGRPPREFCYPAGVSGNPKGRPKGSKNLSTIMKTILNTKINTIKNGKRAKVTVKEAAGLKLAKKALDGDFRSILEILRYAEILDQNSTVTSASSATDDADIVNVFAERVRSGAFGVLDETPSSDTDQVEGNAS
jgi:hypothetical protein